MFESGWSIVAFSSIEVSWRCSGSQINGRFCKPRPLFFVIMYIAYLYSSGIRLLNAAKTRSESGILVFAEMARPVLLNTITHQAPRHAKECAMLVLTRKLQEQIKIGDDVVITILQIRGQAVRVGIQAPRTVRVLRAELPEHAPARTAAEVTAMELKPDAPPIVRHASLARQPLASRLLTRRGPSASVARLPLALPVICRGNV
jgi:carbon storage regulator CsrA